MMKMTKEELETQTFGMGIESTSEVDKGPKEICHVCGKEKKPYTVFLKNDIFSLHQHMSAREDGPICERCDQYNAMTGQFKEATEEEFEIAKKAQWFASMMLKWWEKDNKLNLDSDQDIDLMHKDKRDWEGTALIASWCREHLSPSSKK